MKKNGYYPNVSARIARNPYFRAACDRLERDLARQRTKSKQRGNIVMRKGVYSYGV